MVQQQAYRAVRLPVAVCGDNGEEHGNCYLGFIGLRASFRTFGAYKRGLCCLRA